MPPTRRRPLRVAISPTCTLTLRAMPDATYAALLRVAVRRRRTIAEQAAVVLAAWARRSA